MPPSEASPGKNKGSREWRVTWLTAVTLLRILILQKWNTNMSWQFFRTRVVLQPEVTGAARTWLQAWLLGRAALQFSDGLWYQSKRTLLIPAVLWWFMLSSLMWNFMASHELTRKLCGLSCSGREFGRNPKSETAEELKTTVPTVLNLKLPERRGCWRLSSPLCHQCHHTVGGCGLSPPPLRWISNSG